MRKASCILATLLVFCLTFVTVSCSGEGEREVYDKDFDTKIITDFNGAPLTYVGSVREGRMEINPYYNENEDSFWNDKLKQRYEDVEKKYNIKMEFKVDDGLMMTNYLSGLGWADIYEQWAKALDDLINAGYMNSLNYFDGFLENLASGMWGTDLSLNYLKRGDDYYGFQSYFHFIPFRHICGVMYGNKTLLDRYAVNPFEMIEDGTWTWSGFEDVLRLIGNNYQDPEADMGFLISKSLPHYFPYAAIMSNGGNTVSTDENGHLINNMNDPKVVQAIQWAADLVKNDLATYGDNSGYTDNRTSVCQFPRFADNKCGFWCEYSYVGTVDMSGFLYNDVDFYILPCPCGPQGTYGDWKGFIAGADHYFSVPLTADWDMVNAVLADIYAPLGEDRFSWKEYFAKYNFLYEKSAYMYYTMVENSIPVYEDATNMIQFDAILSGTKSVSDALASVNDRIQATLDNIVNKFIK